MRTCPYAFVRRDDGEVFLKVEGDSDYYYNARMARDFPDNLRPTWPEFSFDDRRDFRPVAKAEDLQTVVEACKLEQ